MSLTNIPASSQWAISDVLKRPSPGRVPFSVEVMPPRDDAAEERLYRAAEVFHDLGASFVSVAYGAGGATRERNSRISRRLAKQPSTTPSNLTLVDPAG